MLKNLRMWSYSLDDYLKLYALSLDEMPQTILDYGAGPSSFNVEMKQLAYQVVSCDPLYTQDLAGITKQSQQALTHFTTEINRAPDQLVWKHFASPIQAEESCRLAREKFLADFLFGRNEKRYIDNKLPHLEFGDFQFNLALCMHALFDRPDVSIEDCFAAINELCRVAEEVRIFPLLNSNGEISPFLGPVILGLQNQNLGVEIRQIDYEFQPGGNAMLRVWSYECKV